MKAATRQPNALCRVANLPVAGRRELGCRRWRRSGHAAKEVRRCGERLTHVVRQRVVAVVPKQVLVLAVRPNELLQALAVLGRRRAARVPLLHRIPLLGWLFKRDELLDESVELLIFITPRITRS